jgi:hypothetical protein
MHASERSSFRGLVRDYDASPAAGDAALRARLEAGAEHARAAYGELARFLDGYVERAPDHDGFGAERYARAANQFLGLTIDPRETYAWGFEQIRAIEAGRIDASCFDPLQRLVLVAALRPERLTAALKLAIAKELGERFVAESPPRGLRARSMRPDGVLNCAHFRELPRADRRTPRGRNSLAPHPPPWHHRRLPRQTDGPRTR